MRNRTEDEKYQHTVELETSTFLSLGSVPYRTGVLPFLPISEELIGLIVSHLATGLVVGCSGCLHYLKFSIIIKI